MSEPNTEDVERRLREKSGGIVLKPHCGSGRVLEFRKISGSGHAFTGTGRVGSQNLDPRAAVRCAQRIVCAADARSVGDS